MIAIHGNLSSREGYKLTRIVEHHCFACIASMY
jgi:hypothetical protein